jgi:hypothetical protein
MDKLVALVSGTYGLVLFAVAIHRAIRFKARPFDYALNFMQAIGLVTLALGLVGIISLDRAVSVNLTLNLAATFMLASDHDRKNPEGRISSSHQ